MVKNRIYLIVVSILFVSLVSTIVFASVNINNVMGTSGDIRFYAKQNENLSVKDICSFQGILCDNTFGCNFTIIYPNMTYLISQGIGTKIGDYWNYTLNETQTSTLGIYETNVYCYNGSNGGQDIFYYQITKDGNSPPSGTFGIVLIIAILGIISLFGYLALTLPDKFYFVKFLFLLMVFILFSVAFYVIREITIANYPTTLGEIFDIVFWVYLYLMLFILLIVFIMFVVNLFSKEKEDEEIYE